MPRNQITKPEQETTEELPELTPKQEGFVMSIAEGMSPLEAYRANYNTENMKPNTQYIEVARLKTNPKVAQWIKYLRQETITAAKCTIDDHISELERLKNKAEATGNMGAAVQAEQLKGKAVGHYVDQVRDVTKHDDRQLIKIIHDLLGKDMAKQALKTLGYEDADIEE